MKFIKPVPIVETGALTRATIGSYFDINGDLQSAAIDVARVSYEPEARLLIEPSATNIILHSEDFSSWSGSAAISSVTTMHNIDMTLLTNPTTAANDYKYRDTTVANNSNPYTVSMFVKQYTTFNTAKLYVALLTGSTPKTAIFTIDFDTKTISLFSGTGVAVYMIEIAPGFFRIAVWIQNNNTGNTLLRTLIYPSYTTPTFTTKSVYAGGVQVELWTVPTSYIKTTSSTVFRAADSSTMTLYSSIPEPDSANTTELAWSSATAYAVGDRAVLTATHKIYECLIANTNFIPSSNITGLTPKWIVVGSTNKWAVFDEAFGTISHYPNHIVIAFTPGYSINGLALLNLNAEYITVVITKPGAAEGVQYINRVDVSGITDYVYTDLVIDATSTLTIEIRRNVWGTGDVSIGKVIAGTTYVMGNTQFGAKTGITDYSTKSTDVFGNTTIVKRKYSKRMTAGVVIDNSIVDSIFNAIATFRSTPMVWIASNNDYRMLIIYGYYQSFDIDVQFSAESFCSLEIIGLT